MRWIIYSARTLVGSLFIVSGLIKANDALGFMYKLEEYFEPGALNLESWTEFALPIAVFVCIAEILLGVAILLGALPKLTSALTAVMMGFFTWLTWYTANCDPLGTKMITDASGQLVEIANQCVLACGCFGNAIPLTAYESFLKDVVLSILSIPIIFGAFTGRIKLNEGKESLYIVTASLVLIFGFSLVMLEWLFPVLFAAVTFLVAEGIKRRTSGVGREWFMALGVTAVCGVFQWSTLAYLPAKDYRPYAVGQSIVENMKSADELGLDAPVYATEYHFRNVKSGMDTVVLSTDWLKIYNEDWFKNTYEKLDRDGREVKVSEGYEPLIMDFQIIDENGSEWTEDFTTAEGVVLMHVSRELDDMETSVQPELNALSEAASAAGWQFIGLTNADGSAHAEYQAAHDVPYAFYTCDQTELKIVVRSNPGLVMMQSGVVIGKWPWRSLPSWDELSALAN